MYSPTIGVTFVPLCNQKSQKKLFRGYINNVIPAGINDLAGTTQPQIVDIEPIKYSRSTCIFCGWVLLAENLLRLRLNFAANYTIMYTRLVHFCSFGFIGNPLINLYLKNAIKIRNEQIGLMLV